MSKLYDKNDELYFNTEDAKHDIPSTETESPIDDVLAKVKATFEAEVSTKKPKEDFFAVKKGKHYYDLKNTSLAPNKLTLIGGKLEERYTKQIENIVFTEEATINPDNLVPLLVLVEMIKNGKTPIVITCPGFNKIVPTLVKVLNVFVKDNFHVLDGIYHMFSNVSTVPTGDQHD